MDECITKCKWGTSLARHFIVHTDILFHVSRREWKL